MLSNYFVENEWLRIFSLKIDNVYRAHEFSFLYNNRLFVLQEGYDIDWERRGVGNILRTYVIQYCVEHKYTEYDFLGGVTYHKSSWGVSIKNNVSITIGKKCLKTMLYLYTPTAIDKLKSIYRAIVPKRLLQWRIDWVNTRKAKKIRETIVHVRSMKEPVNEI
jgi:CelD/BcsL family acetyltransferase involved in cellulose biosynthesis